MIDKAHLKNKPVIFKMASLPKAMNGTVTFVEADGFWIVGKEFSEELLGRASINWLKIPAIFVPTHQLTWLIANQE